MRTAGKININMRECPIVPTASFSAYTSKQISSSHYFSNLSNIFLNLPDSEQIPLWRHCNIFLMFVFDNKFISLAILPLKSMKGLRTLFVGGCFVEMDLLDTQVVMTTMNKNTSFKMVAIFEMLKVEK